MARMGIFIDVSNLYYCVKTKFAGKKLDYLKYMSFVLEDHELVRAYAYGAQNNTEANTFISCLKNFGYTPRYKKPKAFANPNYQIEIEAIHQLIRLCESQTINDLINASVPGLLDQAKSVYEEVRRALREKKDIKKADWDVGLAIDIVRLVNRVDTVVLGSGDGDLAPLVEWVRQQQCRCVVCACNVSHELCEVADQVIEIGEDLLEGR